MAKDPAFLFYPGDWLGGTMSFSRYQKGAYIDLLMCQFNQGHMLLADIKTILGEKDYIEMWESKLKCKFIIDEQGKYYNEKLENESIKRKKYTESRRKNRNSNEDMNNDMISHMLPHMENENSISILSKTKPVKNGKSFSNFKAQGENLFADRDQKHRPKNK